MAGAFPLVMPGLSFVMAGAFPLIMPGLSFVMAGLGPAIHDFGLREDKSWIPGPRPGMTNKAGPRNRDLLLKRAIFVDIRAFRVPRIRNLAPLTYSDRSARHRPQGRSS